MSDLATMLSNAKKQGYEEGKADAIEEFYNRLNRNKSYMNKVDNPWYYVEMAYREMKGIV